MYQLFVKIRSALLVTLTHNLALPLLRWIRRPGRFPYTMEALQNLPIGTLGYALAVFIKERNLSLLPYYAKHDIKHILLQYDTTGEGEVCLQCFMLGNRHLSFPVAATVLYGWLTMPEHWHLFIKAWHQGRAAVSLADWQWFSLLEQPVGQLISKIHGHENL